MTDVAILRKLAIMIDEANEGHSQGVAFATYHDEWGNYYAAVLNRNTGIARSYNIGWFFAMRYEQTEWELGWAVNYTEGGSYFIVDLNNSGRSFDRPLDYRENCGIHANCPQP